MIISYWSDTAATTDFTSDGTDSYFYASYVHLPEKIETVVSFKRALQLLISRTWSLAPLTIRPKLESKRAKQIEPEFWRWFFLRPPPVS